MGEFFARLRAVTHRPVLPGGDAVVITPDFTLDLAAKQAHGHGKLVHLTRTEWRILEVSRISPVASSPTNSSSMRYRGPAIGTKPTTCVR